MTIRLEHETTTPALIVIDMQHDFVDPGAGCYAVGAERLVTPIAALRRRFHDAGLPVVLTQERHRPGGVDLGREGDDGPGNMYAGGTASVPPHCVVGTIGFEIVPELRPAPPDLVVEKPRYSCFIGSDLDLLLRGLGVDTVVVTGVCSNVCVLWTVGDAFQLDYRVVVVEDCLAGTSHDEHNAALTVMRGLLGDAALATADGVAAWLGTRPAEVRA